MTRLLRAAAVAAALAVVGVTGGCAHVPRLAASWYYDPDDKGQSHWHILLVNRTRFDGAIVKIALNSVNGPELTPDHVYPDVLAAGQAISLGIPSVNADPPHTYNCIPVSLFVSLSTRRKPLAVIMFRDPLPTTYIESKALLNCRAPAGS